MPGAWYSVTCVDQSTGVVNTQTEWITNQSTAGTPAVDPYSVALQAENSLVLPAPTSHFDPANASVVNLPTWLWVDAGLWHSYTVTASVGPVSATAVATPVSVVWSMGDGSEVTCAGPGTAYDPTRPASAQTTQCSYRYVTSSAGQPSPDGNPNDGAFGVTATVTWSVAWSAQGAPGGGVLPTLFTSTRASIRVEQVQSINAALHGGPPNAVLATGLPA